MPARVGPVEQLVFSNDETLRLLRETGLAQFRLRLFRRGPIGGPSLHARFENATYQHFQDATWITELCGGGRYELEASGLWDSRFEPNLIRPIGGFITVLLDGALRDVDLGAPARLGWRGPLEMTYPIPGTMVEDAPEKRRVPALREPRRSITVGFNPDIGVLMMDGKAGGFPPHIQTGYFDRLFLFGEPTQPTFARLTNHDFSFGQGRQETRGSLPGVQIRVGGRVQRGGHYSLEVLQACSKGHVEGSLLETQGQILKAMGEREAYEGVVDVMVKLYTALERLKSMPLTGFALNPVIAFVQNEDVQIEGVPSGMRLYLTGVCEHEGSGR